MIFVVLYLIPRSQVYFIVWLTVQRGMLEHFASNKLGIFQMFAVSILSIEG